MIIKNKTITMKVTMNHSSEGIHNLNLWEEGVVGSRQDISNRKKEMVYDLCGYIWMS